MTKISNKETRIIPMEENEVWKWIKKKKKKKKKKKIRSYNGTTLNKVKA